MDPDGKNAKQISRERRWFVNSPTWSPDGELHLRAPALRRRSDRSAPARSGCITRPVRPTACRSPSGIGSQKDNGEPDISPDGRYLYYSKDVTPGLNFEYNKDPNGTIYAVMRRDLTTGRERRAVSVQGGSVTPQVSPDGKTLAYIRRVRLKSFLYLRDLETGRDRELFGNRRQGPAGSLGGPRPVSAVRVDARRQVDRDLGRRQDLERRCRVRQGPQIPFTARSSRRSTRRCASSRTSTPTSSRSGCCATCVSRRTARSVVYSALGQLYSRQLPDGQPAAAHEGRSSRVLPVVLPRRPVDRLHDLDRCRRTAASA